MEQCTLGGARKLERKPAKWKSGVTTGLTMLAVFAFFAVNLKTNPPAFAQTSQPIKSAAPAASTANTPLVKDDPEAKPLSQYQAPAANGSSAGTGDLLTRVGVDLGVVVALVFVCAAGWKKFRGTSIQTQDKPAEAIRVADTITLAPQRLLHLVEIGGQRMVLASTPQQVTVVSVLGQPELPVVQPAQAVVSPHAAAVQGETPSEDWFANVLARLDAREASGCNEPAVAVAAVQSAPKKPSLFQHAGVGPND